MNYFLFNNSKKNILQCSSDSLVLLDLCSQFILLRENHMTEYVTDTKIQDGAKKRFTVVCMQNNTIINK